MGTCWDPLRDSLRDDIEASLARDGAIPGCLIRAHPRPVKGCPSCARTRAMTLAHFWGHDEPWLAA